MATNAALRNVNCRAAFFNAKVRRFVVTFVESDILRFAFLVVVVVVVTAVVTGVVGGLPARKFVARSGVGGWFRFVRSVFDYVLVKNAG